MKSKVERNREIVRSKALLCMLSARVGAKSVYGFASRFDDLSTCGSCTMESNRWHRVFNGKQPLTARAINDLVAVFPDAIGFYKRGPFDLWGAVWGDLLALSDIANEGAKSFTLDRLLDEFEADILLAESCLEPLSIFHLAKAVALHRLAHGMNSITALDVDLQGTYRCVNRCLNDDSVIGALNDLGVLDELRAELSWIALDARATVSSAARWDALAERLDWVT